MENVEAHVLGTVYRNEENGYSVVSIRVGRKETTAVGILPQLTSGEQVILTGDWVTHAQYGQQLKVASCEIRQPTTLLGIERFLASGLIKGVGQATARQIVETFGQETLQILSDNPEKLIRISGIGRKRAYQIAESYHEHIGERQAMIFLQGYGVSPALAHKISKRFGQATQKITRQNPYRLCDEVEGVGFQTADRIGMSMGIAQDSDFRIRSAIKYILSEAAASAGHVYLPKKELIERSAYMLRCDKELVLRQFQSLTISREIVCRQESEDEDVFVYIPAFDSAQKEIAQRLVLLMSKEFGKTGRNILKEIQLFEAKHQISFSHRQREAIQMALSNGVQVITGGPGTGKTTIIRCILTLLHSDQCKVALCAPTGRAAKRMTEATGEEAKTIHRMLGFQGSSSTFLRNEEKPIDADAVIVDEASMVDLMLMRALLRAVKRGMRLIIVGDADQLPSVGAGNVLGDILDSRVVPQVRLTDIFRQQETSRIVVNAHRINHGELPLLNEKGTDFFFERKVDFASCAQSVVQLVTTRLPGFMKLNQENISAQAMREIQVLAAAKKGECGVWNLNVLLQKELNPPGRFKPEIKYGQNTFRLGDKVMQMHNDYDIVWQKKVNGEFEQGTGIFNGDVGFITEVDEESRCLTVLFDDDREVVYETGKLQNLDLAYCLSVHKSQGSEFPAVVMPVVGGPPMLMTRNLFYTALTRAKKLVVLVGREDAIAQMVNNNHIMRRYTTLAKRLQSIADWGKGANPEEEEA